MINKKLNTVRFTKVETEMAEFTSVDYLLKIFDLSLYKYQWINRNISRKIRLWAISRVNRFSCYLYDLNSGEKTDVQK